MKVLVLVVVLGLLASSAQAIDIQQCISCILTKCLPCKDVCYPDPLNFQCPLCVLTKCSACVSVCNPFMRVKMMADFGNGMETKEFCECPTAQETDYIPQRWRRPIY